MGYYERSEQQCIFAFNMQIDFLRKKKEEKKAGEAVILFAFYN